MPGTKPPLAPCPQSLPGSTSAATTCVAVVNEEGGAACRLFTAGLDGLIYEQASRHFLRFFLPCISALPIWVSMCLALAASAAPATGPLCCTSCLLMFGCRSVAPPHAFQLPSCNPLPAAAPASRLQNAETRTACASCDSYGGAVWQLEPEPLGCVAAGELPRLAAACDDGCVRLFTVDVGVPGAAYSKSLPRVEGRTLAVAWHPGGKAVASAGTDGCIHVWALEGNRELLRITVGELGWLAAGQEGSAREAARDSKRACVG